MKNDSNAAAFKPLATQSETRRDRNGIRPDHGTFAKGVKSLEKQHRGHDGDGH